MCVVHNTYLVQSSRVGFSLVAGPKHCCNWFLCNRLGTSVIRIGAHPRIFVQFALLSKLEQWTWRLLLLCL